MLKNTYKYLFDFITMIGVIGIVFGLIQLLNYTGDSAHAAQISNTSYISYAECLDHIDPNLLAKGYEVYAVIYIPDGFVSHSVSMFCPITGHVHYFLKKK